MYSIQHCLQRMTLNCKTMFLCTAFRIANALLFVISPWDISLEANVLSAEENSTDGVTFGQRNGCPWGFFSGSCLTGELCACVNLIPNICICAASWSSQLIPGLPQFCPHRIYYIRMMWQRPPSCACWLSSPFLLACHADSDLNSLDLILPTLWSVMHCYLSLPSATFPNILWPICWLVN